MVAAPRIVPSRVAAIALAALAACAVWLVAGRSARTAGRLAPSTSVHALPLQAQGTISSALGAVRPAFAARRSAGAWRLAGGGVSAAIGPRGTVFGTGAA
ncbi:MAG: hypothetical protein ACRDLV_09430, partial [Solirubrobacteraceae bacterium]